MSSRIVLLGACVLCLAGCGKQPPSAREGWSKACHAHEHVPASAEGGGRAVQIVRWIEANVSEPTVREAFALAARSTGDKQALLRAAAQQAGVTDCPVLETIWRPPAP